MGVSANVTNNKQDTPALWAARGNHIATMRRLINLKSNLNHQNDKGSTPLYWAVRYGFRDMVKLLVQEGKADIHQKRKLGLVSPIVLAAALGYNGILQILLDFGADVNTKITNNQTALHFAASGGMDTTAEKLLENKAECDVMDDMGNTPLHLATKNGHLSTMTILCAHGANIETRNKVGKTVWNLAMESPDLDVLKVVVKLYRRKTRMQGRKLIFPIGKTPLHEAAMLGDVEKIQYLIQEGADPHAKDLNNNTFCHLASRENKEDILLAFLSNGDINVQNNDGDTAMHLAAEKGHMESVKVLIKKSQLDITNTNKYTPLHKAVWSDAASHAVVKILVENIVKNNNWSLVDAKDDHGNTALHVAAIKNHADVIFELGPLNPSILNYSGDNPFHAAAKLGNTAAIDAMFIVFNKPGKGLDIDQQNGEGETLVHISAKTGISEIVQELIEVGADLGVKNKQGNTVLHELAEETIDSPGHVQKLLAVYNEIVESASIWWCIKNDLPRPDEGSYMFLQHQRTALIYLISEVYNYHGYNVLGYCTKIGALDLFAQILNTDNVCRLSAGKKYVFDITNMTPDTVSEKVKKKHKKSSVYSNPVSIGVMSDDDEYDGVIPSHDSYLDTIVSMRDEILATKFLDVTPVKQISENLFNAYQWIYIVLMFLHIVYMSCFTAYAIPSASVVYNTTAQDVKHTDPPTIFPFILFLTWPAILIIFALMSFISTLKRTARQYRKQHKETNGQKSDSCKLSEVPSSFIAWLFNNLGTLTTWIFSGFVIAWYVLYLTNSKQQVYVLSITMVIGWMFTIVFTKGFKNVHAFSTMLSYIIIRDVSRFLVIYMFVLLGFGFAIHTLFQIPVSVASLYKSPWDTLFLTFNLMVGSGELFDESFDESYTNAGSSSTYVKVVYLVYILLATIILLNLLIAMLSDTYNDIKSREGTTWRVRSVQMALRIERWMPILKKIVTKTGVMDFATDYDTQSQRWLLTLAGEKVIDDKEKNVSEITRGLQRMEERMNIMQTAYGDISIKLQNMMTQIEGLSINEQGQIPTRNGETSPRSATGRPKTAGLKKRRTKNKLY